jgi:hypothetical protein
MTLASISPTETSFFLFILRERFGFPMIVGQKYSFAVLIPLLWCNYSNADARSL